MRRLTLVYRGEGGPERIGLEIEGARCAFSREGKRESAEWAALPDGRLSLLFDDGRQICGRVLPAEDGSVAIVTAGETRSVSLADPLHDRLAHASDQGSTAHGEEEVRASIPGRVVEVAVRAGERILPGGLLLVLEAMKMQNEIRSARGGTVARVHVEAGKAVEGGAMLVTVHPDGVRP